MTSFVFDDYVRATMGGATNAADNSALSPQQVQRVADYLKSPGSGADGTSSYADFVASRMAAHPPALPAGYDYVGFSGKDSAGRSNYSNAVEYTKELGGGGKAGIIGDTPWGHFIDKSSASREFGAIEGKFATFLAQEGIKPFGGAAKGALQDMMWNAGSSPYLENAMKSGRPFVAFVENAPMGRGFSTFELPTAQQFPNAVANGYPMRSFGPDPLTFASKSAGEFQQLEKSLAESASTHSGHAVTVGDLRGKVYVASGYNATNQSIFGQPLTEFRQLSADQMSSVSKAWSAQEAARLASVSTAGAAEQARAHAVEQQAPRGPPSPEGIKAPEVARVPNPSATLESEAAAAGRAGPGLATKALGVAGAAAVVYDGAKTLGRTSDLLHAGNVTGGQSEITHFASRNLGMLAGAEVVGGAAALAGVESGPGLLVTGAIGAVGGAIAGDKIANAIDNHRIYNQDDGKGHSWHYEPEHPEHGWTRTETVIKASAGGMPTLARESHTADASTATMLNYKASSTAVDLALAHTNTPKDPYVQPEGPHDSHGVSQAPWVRDPQSHAWSRHVTDQIMEHGMTSAHTEKATPVRAAQLEQAASATIAANLSDTPQGIAQHYVDAHRRNGWNAQGPVPESVTHALRQPQNVRDASDGHTYTRGDDGRWRTPGMIYGTNEAEGNVRDELNATQRAAEQGKVPGAPSSAMLNHPSHPDHALFRQAETHVLALDAKHGHVPDQGSENLAAAVAVAAKQGGLRKIDSLTLSEDGSKVFVTDVVIPKTLNNVASVDTVKAIQTPVAQSSEAIAMASVQQASQANAPVQQQTAQSPVQGLPGRIA